MKRLGTQIYAAVHSGKLQQPFSAAMVKKVSSDWAAKTYYTFLGKHSVGNGYTTELFISCSPSDTTRHPCWYPKSQ
jgi:hypothetical protein